MGRVSDRGYWPFWSNAAPSATVFIAFFWCLWQKTRTSPTYPIASIPLLKIFVCAASLALAAPCLAAGYFSGIRPPEAKEPRRLQAVPQAAAQPPKQTSRYQLLAQPRDDVKKTRRARPQVQPGTKAR